MGVVVVEVCTHPGLMWEVNYSQVGSISPTQQQDVQPTEFNTCNNSCPKKINIIQQNTSNRTVRCDILFAMGYIGGSTIEID